MTSRSLLLIPTQMEYEALIKQLPSSFGRLGEPTAAWRTELCGFGPIAAAATTARLLAEYEPQRVVLIGIAGTYVEQLEPGQAYRFSSVRQYGVGVGSGSRYQSMGQLGWAALPEMNDRTDKDTFQLCAEGSRTVGELLTCCAAAADAAEVQQRRDHAPQALAEDMEAYAVALACDVAGISLQVIRGISNHAGDRHHPDWQIEPALRSAAQLLCEH